eukprot:gene6053-biopygen13073
MPAGAGIRDPAIPGRARVSGPTDGTHGVGEWGRASLEELDVGEVGEVVLRHHVRRHEHLHLPHAARLRLDELAPLPAAFRVRGFPLCELLQSGATSLARVRSWHSCVRYKKSGGALGGPLKSNSQVSRTYRLWRPDPT